MPTDQRVCPATLDDRNILPMQRGRSLESVLYRSELAVATLAKSIAPEADQLMALLPRTVKHHCCVLNAARDHDHLLATRIDAIDWRRIGKNLARVFAW